MKHKTIQQLRDSLKKVLKRGRPKQLKKLRKAYHGKRLKKWWSDYANAEEITIVECKDIEGVRSNGGMKGGHTHNHFYNVCNRHLKRSKDRRKRLFKELLDKKTCIDVLNNGVQNPKCRESFVRAIFK